MYYLEELTLGKMIVHLLDSCLSTPILSMQEMIPDMDTHTLIANHIIKTLNDDALKTCVFDEGYNLFHAYVNAYIQEPSGFILMSNQLTELLFSMMLSNPEIAPCDLCIVEFFYKGTPYLGILKMNYQSAYIHYTDYDGDLNINSIVQHRNILPGSNQRIHEAVIVQLTDLAVFVLEKQVEIEGLKEYYLSKRVIKCHTQLSSKEQYAIVKKAADHVTKKFFEEDVEKKMAITQELYNHVEDSGTINLDSFAKEAFSTNEEVKSIFFEEIEKRGIVSPTIQLSEKTISRSFESQRIKTDNGIEIKIPMSLYNNPENIELVMSPDGKMNIVIKNVIIVN